MAAPKCDGLRQPGRHGLEEWSLRGSGSPDVTRITEQSVETHALRVTGELGEGQRRLRRAHAGAAQADIQLNQQSDFCSRCGRGGRERRNCRP